MHYWIVIGDVPPGVRHQVETLPHPNVQLVFSNEPPAGALVHGVHTSKSHAYSQAAPACLA